MFKMAGVGCGIRDAKPSFWVLSLPFRCILFIILLCCCPSSTAALPTLLSSDRMSNIRLDFSMTAEQLPIADYSPEQLLNTAIAAQNFLCILPRKQHGEPLSNLDVGHGEATKIELENGRLSSTTPHHRHLPPPKLQYADPQIEEYLKLARLANYIGKCMHLKELHEQRVYIICFRVSLTIGKLKGEDKGGIPISTVDLVEHFDQESERLWANGSLSQWYFNKETGNSTKVIFSCGPSFWNSSAIIRISPSVTMISLKGPTFCDYRESNPFKPPLTHLLTDFQDWCVNTTYSSSTWNYEFCYPDSLIQYHFRPGNDKTEIFLLGTLLEGPVVMSWFFHSWQDGYPMLRSGLREKYRNNYKRYTYLPLELVPFPQHLMPTQEYKTQKALLLHLKNGTRCLDYRSYRDAKIYFICPENFLAIKKNYLHSVSEVNICEYEAVIVSLYACSHPELLPPMKPLIEEIRCYPKAERLPSISSSNNLYNESLQNSSISQKRAEAHTLYSSFIALESLPANFTFIPFMETPHIYFGFGKYIRKRFSEISPLFRVGDVVRHRWWYYRAVILSWDSECYAPSSWTSKVYREYAYKYKQWPHYLLLVQQSDLPSSVSLLYTYVPEIGLTFCTEEECQLNPPYLDEYFSHFNPTLKRWIPKQEDLDNFKCDFPTDFDVSSSVAAAASPSTMEKNFSIEKDSSSYTFSFHEEL
ncbi:hemimethylated Dna binding domain-containing protein [Cardiosporidium cionae]|uniref:Hemimethylated Dna binding domain-containing protein n=1 Tax=Cardiosporidium cionae TaxID=476202 RepID=A0ABQ7JC35_9APIC|nr:hemimethylated Dna binding domain-containing protein [Cardiosporidium cionae]|eukprot:KAF8821490.1 hemimethylated Dna binding domain-containing protein [Cardiosporidium cionae]